MHPQVRWHDLEGPVNVYPTFYLKGLDMGKATLSKNFPTNKPPF